MGLACAFLMGRTSWRLKMSDSVISEVLPSLVLESTSVVSVDWDLCVEHLLLLLAMLY